MANEIDMEKGLNTRKRTYTAEEIAAVAQHEYESWVLRIPLLSFQMIRGPRGAVKDEWIDAGRAYEVSSRARVDQIATTLENLQLNENLRLMHTPERLRELCYERAMYPPTMNVSDNVLAQYEFSLIKENEREAINSFLRYHLKRKASKIMDQIWNVEVLKWTKDPDSDRVTFFTDEQKRLAGRRSVKTLASYLKQFVPDAPDHELRELHSAVLAMHEKDDRYEVHVGLSASQIVDIYENTNFSSCMKRDGGEYIDEDLNFHPVEAYNSPDINVFGLWDKKFCCYVARTVANANTEEWCTIYPGDGTGKRGTASNRLKRWLLHNGYQQSYSALAGCRVDAIRVDGDGWLLPYVDGGSPRLIIERSNGKVKGILAEYDSDLRAIGIERRSACTIFAAQPTRGYVNDYDTTTMRHEE